MLTGSVLAGFTYYLQSEESQVALAAFSVLVFLVALAITGVICLIGIVAYIRALELRDALPQDNVSPGPGWQESPNLRSPRQAVKHPSSASIRVSRPRSLSLHNVSTTAY
jgi:hypothetical protein